MTHLVTSLAGIKWNKRLVNRIDFKLSTTKSLEIPRDKPIRRMTLRFFFKITNTVTAPTILEGDILNLIKRIRVLLNGDDKKYDVTGVQTFYLEKNDKHSEPYLSKAPTAASAVATAEVLLTIDFSSAQNRQDEGDIGELLMSHRFSSVFLEIDWGAAADLASANAPTISEVTGESGCDVEIREASGQVEVKDLSKPDSASKKISVFELDTTDIRVGVDTKTVDKAYANLDDASLQSNVRPSPTVILTTMFIVRDNKIRDNALIEKIRLQQDSPDTLQMIEGRFKTMWAEQKAENEIESIDTGILYFDWEDMLEHGLITEGAETNKKFRFQAKAPVDSTNSTIEIVTRYISQARA